MHDNPALCLSAQRSIPSSIPQSLETLFVRLLTSYLTIDPGSCLSHHPGPCLSFSSYLTAHPLRVMSVLLIAMTLPLFSLAGISAEPLHPSPYEIIITNNNNMHSEPSSTTPDAVKQLKLTDELTTRYAIHTIIPRCM